MKIKPLKSTIVQLNLAPTDEDESLTLDFYPNFYDENPFRYSITFELVFVHIEKVKVECKFIMDFETEVEIEKGFSDSSFVKVNSPAIAYPFLRSSLATVFLNCGYSPAMLPSVNFTAINKDG